MGTVDAMTDDAAEPVLDPTARLLAVHADLRGRADAIDAALTRISEGAYGTCTACGRTLPTERLDAIPWAATCVAC